MVAYMVPIKRIIMIIVCLLDVTKKIVAIKMIQFLYIARMLCHAIKTYS
jgi:hypothetical protein